MFQVQGRQYFCPKLFQQHYNILLLTKIGSCDFYSQPKQKDNYFHGPFLEKLFKYCKQQNPSLKKSWISRFPTPETMHLIILSQQSYGLFCTYTMYRK